MFTLLFSIYQRVYFGIMHGKKKVEAGAEICYAIILLALTGRHHVEEMADHNDLEQDRPCVYLAAAYCLWRQDRF